MDDLASYRGPYFRTGVDGAGNSWKISDDPSVETKRLARNPSNWELQKPPMKYLLPGRPELIPTIPSVVASASCSSINETSFGWAAGGRAKDPPLEVFVSKEYLKKMVMEIWKETAKEQQIIQPPEPKTQNRPMKKKESKLEVTEVKRTLGLGAESQRKDSSTGIQKANPLAASTIVRRRMTAREEREHAFACFDRMSCDPPQTPPQPSQVKSSTTTLSPVVQEQKKKKVKPKKDQGILQDFPSLPPSYDPTAQIYHYHMQYQNHTPPLSQEDVFEPPSPVKPRKKAKSKLIFESREAALNSTLVVSKIPTTGGWFNDGMLPPSAPPTPKPKRKVVKKYDAFGPLLSTNWATLQQRNPVIANSYQGFARSPPLEDQVRHSIPQKHKTKIQETPSKNPPPPPPQPKPKKAIHPFKQFPLHIPGPKKNDLNMYVSRYVDSELDLLRNDIKIKSK